MTSPPTATAELSADERAQLERHAQAFKALGDANRLRMLQLICARQEVCVCELEPLFDLSQPTVSHHLKQLRSAGLVSAERRGTWVYYRALHDRLREVGVLGLLVETSAPR